MSIAAWISKINGGLPPNLHNHPSKRVIKRILSSYSETPQKEFRPKLYIIPYKLYITQSIWIYEVFLHFYPDPISYSIYPL